jgi:nucleotide-binding universal stress UspA family protein
MEIHHILAPTDFSEVSQQVLIEALALAQTFGARLSLLHVIELPAFPLEGLAPATPGVTLLEDWERQAQRELAALLPEADTAKVPLARHAVVGSPYRKIVEMAAAEQVDLIVMATHGRTGLTHLLMGSVAERVVRTAPCPVLTMRPRQEAKGESGGQR